MRTPFVGWKRGESVEKSRYGALCSFFLGWRDGDLQDAILVELGDGRPVFGHLLERQDGRPRESVFDLVCAR